MSDPNTQDERCGRLIDIPEGAGRFNAIRMAYVAICNGDPCAAAILAEFEYWTSCREADEAGEVWIYQSQPDLQTHFYGIFRLTKDIKPAMKLLTEELGYLHKRKNKRNPLDKTLEYRFDVAAVQAAVDFWSAAYLQDGKSAQREVTDDHSRSRGRPAEKSNATDGRSDMTDGRSNTTDGRSNTTDASVTGDRVLESLNTESSQEESVEAPAETRAGAREAAAAGQIPFPAPLKLVRASPNGAAAAANERASPERGGEDHDGANAKIFALYKSRIGPYDDPAIRDELARWDATLPEAKIEEAFMQLNGRAIDPAKRWPYVRAILQRMLTEQEAAAKQAAVWATAADEVIDELADRWRMPETPREFTGDPEAARSWERTLIHLESVLSVSTFDVYLRGTRLVDVQGDTYVIAARNEYARNHLQAKLYRNVASALGNISGKRDRVTIEFVVQDELERA